MFGGCTIPGACNFDVAANNDRSCDFTSCVGCTDDAACNYIGATLPVTATTPRRTSIATATVSWRIAVRLWWKDAPMRVHATATRLQTRKRKLRIRVVCRMCLLHCENYDPSATRDDGNCIFEGCTDGEFAAYAPQANVNEAWCSTLLQCRLQRDGTVQVEDLTQFLQAYALAAPSWGGVTWVGSACDVDPLTEEELLAAVLSSKARDHGTLHAACLAAATPVPSTLSSMRDKTTGFACLQAARTWRP